MTVTKASVYSLGSAILIQYYHVMNRHWGIAYATLCINVTQ